MIPQVWVSLVPFDFNLPAHWTEILPWQNTLMPFQGRTDPNRSCQPQVLCSHQIKHNLVWTGSLPHCKSLFTSCCLTNCKASEETLERGKKGYDEKAEQKAIHALFNISLGVYWLYSICGLHYSFSESFAPWRFYDLWTLSLSCGCKPVCSAWHCMAEFLSIFLNHLCSVVLLTGLLSLAVFLDFAL